MSIAHIALACAIGAGLGFHLSWQIYLELWWIGVLIGGLHFELVSVRWLKLARQPAD